MNARALRHAAGDWHADGRAAVVVEVIAARGSVPRGAGTRMLVAADATLGTIGGGHLELQAISAARAALARGSVQASEKTFALGPSLGQCCGGTVTLGFAALAADALARWPLPPPLFHLQLHGAGHVGRAIATLLATLDCDVDWYDERDDGFPATTALGSPWPAHIRATAADTVEREVAHAPAGAFYLVLTHEHALDLRIVEAILSRGDAAFCGLIGSRTKRVRFERKLAERGVAGDAIATLTCPIGIDGVGDKSPAIIAAAVVAQLLVLAERRGVGEVVADERGAGCR